MHMHKLVAFAPLYEKLVSIDFQLKRNDFSLSFLFQLSAPQELLNTLHWPEPKQEQASRQDELWKTTVFELFLADADKKAYYEFNFSPSWDWAAYAFENEREGMRTLTEVKQNPLNKILRKEKELQFAGNIDLKKLEIENSLEVSATAILDWGNQLEYWATAHTADQPDFHKRDSFVIQV